MSELHRWHQANEAYLAAALAWLRLRLARLIGALSAPAPGPSALGDPAEAELAEAQLGEAELAEARRRMDALEEADPAPALALLGDRLGLSAFERQVLLLCAAMELDTRLPALCAAAQDNPHRPYPTFGLALALFDEPAWDVLSPERPLRYWRLIEIHQPGAVPLVASALAADERIVNYLKGLNYPDDRLGPHFVAFDEPDGCSPLPPSQQAVARSIAETLRSAATGGGFPEEPHHQASGPLLPFIGPAPLIQLLGACHASKQLIARQAAREMGLHLFRLPAELLPSHPGELETLARLWQRESALLPLGLYVEHSAGGAEGGMAERWSLLRRFLGRTSGVVFLDTHEAAPCPGRRLAVWDVGRPTRAEQCAAWSAALGTGSGQEAVLLAGQFDLDAAAIRRIVYSASAGAPSGGAGLAERLWEGCRRQARPRLDALAQRIEIKAGWDDLVLPAEPRGLLRQIAGQVRRRVRVYDDWGFRSRMNRGLGVSALFAGESGTGKTMAAEVLAGELRLDLFRIDLSAVVSKYIGETEKNLRRLFDAAEGGGAILFFDEADALFGKRSEVKDSHDRYANIEVNYLLQRMECYGGLAILATNMKDSLDAAFTRRLRFIVNFPVPAAAERQRMWRLAFPAATPLAALDCERLSRLNLTGGSIHNVALNAAFGAAESGPSVDMPAIMAAARMEFRKLNKPTSAADFRCHETNGVPA